jgi:hypothetical protein
MAYRWSPRTWRLQGVSCVVWLFIAYMAYESYRRVLTDSGK